MLPDAPQYSVNLRQLKLGDRTPRKEPPARPSHQPRPACGTADACAVGGDTGVRVHLTVDLRDQHEGEAPFERDARGARALPDAPQTVELIPHFLRAGANLVGGHFR